MSDVTRYLWDEEDDGSPCLRPDPSGDYMLAADYERDVLAAEVRGWNAALEGVISACQADWRFEDHNDWYLDAVAALRKPTEREVGPCQPCRQGRCEDCQRLGLGCACCKPLTREEATDD